MRSSTAGGQTRRIPLTRERTLRAAVALADGFGLDLILNGLESVESVHRGLSAR